VGYAVLFPGQGSQSVGMGADLFQAGSEFLGARAGEILEWSLRDACLTGPEEYLTRTEIAQPALFAVSYALWAHLRDRMETPPAGAAGHSLGEYTALAAAGVMDYETGLSLVAARGRAMAAAADREPSGMAALIGADPGQAESLASARRADGGRLWVANLNAPGQVVVAGGIEDIEWATAHARDHGIRRAVPLKVAGAFHSPFMEPAAADLAEAIGAATFGEASFPVWANATATPHTGGAGSMLLRQLTAPVRFEESLRSMADAGADAFVHIGPGDVTAGLARRSIQDGAVHVVSSLADVEPVVAALSASV
jgi:[acyl-carrier-protein] S-malonyltransferase